MGVLRKEGIDVETCVGAPSCVWEQGVFGYWVFMSMEPGMWEWVRGHEWGTSHHVCRLRALPVHRLVCPCTWLLPLHPCRRLADPTLKLGALVLTTTPGERAEVAGLRIDNDGWEWVPLQEGAEASEEERIRGFTVVRSTQTILGR